MSDTHTDNDTDNDTSTAAPGDEAPEAAAGDADTDAATDAPEPEAGGETADAPEPEDSDAHVPEAETEAGDADVEAAQTEAAETADAETEPGADAAETEAAETADAGTETAETADAETEPGADDAETETADAETEAAETDDAADAETGAAEAAAADGEVDPELAVVSGDELLEQQAVVVDNPYTRPGRWFVVHTQSGYEKKVKQNLEARIHSMNAEEAVYEVVIPMEDYVDFKNGKRVVAQRKMFPGYLLVRAELDDTAWYVIRNTPGVTGFVGQGAKPSPLPRRDVEAFLMPKGTEEQVATRAKPRLEYEIGETVRVREGPFADFSGEVIELNEDQLKLKVLVNIFGRETPVELEFSKVAKL
jgi:transcription termination/antitermination protein NusG